MEAAITAARRGHDVTLIEKQNRLGGNLHPAGAAFFKDDIRKLCQVLIRRVECAGVKVVLNKTATPADIEDMAPDAVMIAIGSKWRECHNGH